MMRLFILSTSVVILAFTAYLFAESVPNESDKPPSDSKNSAPNQQPGGPTAVNFDAVKTQIHATDEEWKVIGPKLKKIMSARQTAEWGLNSNGMNNSFRGRFFGAPGDRGRFGPPGGPDGSGPGNFGPPPGSGNSFDPPGTGVSPGDFGPKDFNRNESAQNEADRKMPNRGDSKQGGVDRGGAERTAKGRGNHDAVPPSSNKNAPDIAPPPGGGPDGAPPNFAGGPLGFGGPHNALAQALRDLQTATADKNSTPEQIQEKVATVRSARQKARGDSAAAQKDLLQLLTPDQEAVLVGLGYLE